MFGNRFYHNLMKKYVTYFGTLFNDITIDRTDAANKVSTLKVPLSYSPRNKMIERLDKFATLDDEREIAVQLPRMSFENISISYDAQRHMNTMSKIRNPNSPSSDMDFVYTPAPYNITFLLSIYVKNIEDGSKIIEQILPYFEPDWVESLVLIPEVPKAYDIPVIIRDVALRDNFEGNKESNRYIIWSVTFEMKAYFFQNVKRRAIIKKAISTVLSGYGLEETITITPGLTANGQPTSDASNAIPFMDVLPFDDYGFVTNIDTPITMRPVDEPDSQSP
jgi:hypothetical protein